LVKRILHPKKRIGWRSSIAVGFLPITHLSSEVAIAIIGEQPGFLSAATRAATRVSVILTVIMMPRYVTCYNQKQRKKQDTSLVLFIDGKII
jgi:hypothetical protein